MSSDIDPAILEALHLDPTSAKLQTHGSSGFASTFKIVAATKDGQKVEYFVKTSAESNAEVMFRGEHASLNAIRSVVPNFCPEAYAYGAMKSDPQKYFLATDFLALGARGGSGGGGSGLSLAAKLAKLHTTPAPIPEGFPFDKPMFGFPVPTCCGSRVQDNTWRESWADFFADNRLRSVCRDFCDKELSDAVEKVASTVVPRLLGDDHLKGCIPVVVHGDLWSGNHSRGVFSNNKGGGGTEEVVYDASSVYGHSEYELGITRMFGGFGGSFWDEYEKLVPKTEPKEEWNDRLLLYELYHHLNHFAMFGGGYKSGAMSIIKKLISKYG
ncbi:fructosamine kinase [Diplogelasinospora grovesii]|uniref:protein-ribulosamine 3-kinase n=1 Tax=Diplogelasinospora grovesii TaxID=303347 RepID=A0AAN6S7Z6_9PEZI|nr:fructosamine kinase [Diplogelasinospora grovesii]